MERIINNPTDFPFTIRLDHVDLHESLFRIDIACIPISEIHLLSDIDERIYPSDLEYPDNPREVKEYYYIELSFHNAISNPHKIHYATEYISEHHDDYYEKDRIEKLDLSILIKSQEIRLILHGNLFSQHYVCGRGWSQSSTSIHEFIVLQDGTIVARQDNTYDVQ